jgi:iron-sulfur cluster repair protein YtfE (RIC family)
MNALDLLKNQHDEVMELFSQLEQTDDPDEKDALFQELADNLAAHTTIEEKIFYPAAYAKGTGDKLRVALQEHLAIKRVLADLLHMTPDHDSFDAKVKVLKDEFEHHMEEEEGELFPAVERELGAVELNRLGADLDSLFEEEMQGDPSAAVPAQTEEAPLR